MTNESVASGVHPRKSLNNKTLESTLKTRYSDSSKMTETAEMIAQLRVADDRIDGIDPSDLPPNYLEERATPVDEDSEPKRAAYLHANMVFGRAANDAAFPTKTQQMEL